VNNVGGKPQNQALGWVAGALERIEG